MDMFDTRVMMRALELLRPPRTFLLDTFFQEQSDSETDTVDIDVIKRSRRMAPFQRPIHAGKVVSREGFASRTIRVPYLKPKMVTRAADMLKRQPGDTVYDAKSPADRAREQLARDMETLQDMIVRREEWMAAQALVLGKVEIKGDEVHAEVDFLRDADHQITLTGGDRWGQEGVQIDSDLVAWRSLISQATGLTARNAVLGSDAAEVVLHDEALRKLLDNRRTEAGMLRVTEAPIDGVTYLGNLRGIDLWAYEDWYIDDDTGDELPMIPADRVVLGVSGPSARAVRHYGAIQDLEATSRGRWFPKTWTEQDPSARWLQIQSAPLPATHTSDGYVSAKVL